MPQLDVIPLRWVHNELPDVCVSRRLIVCSSRFQATTLTRCNLNRVPAQPGQRTSINIIAELPLDRLRTFGDLFAGFATEPELAYSVNWKKRLDIATKALKVAEVVCDAAVLL